MSTATVAPKQVSSTPDHKQVMRLMKAVGSKSGYTPIPQVQHQWQKLVVPPSVHQLWSWMVDHTLYWGHRSPFAISKDGEELHIENAAAALGWNVANARRTWKYGLAIGIWRNGTDKADLRRMYICGELQPDPRYKMPNEEDQKNEYEARRNVPPYLRAQIEALPAEKQAEFWDAYDEHESVRREGLAELMGILRKVLDEGDDNELYHAFGITKNRIDRKRSEPPEELAARQAREAAILPFIREFVQNVAADVQSQGWKPTDPSDELAASQARVAHLLPAVQKFMQTVEDRVQSRKTAEYNTAQSNGTDSATLYPQSKHQTKPEPSSSSSSESDSHPREKQSRDGEKASVQGEPPRNPDTTQGRGALGKQEPRADRNWTDEFGVDRNEAMRLSGELGCDLKAACQILSSVRTKDPKISVREIVLLAVLKQEQLNGSQKNIVGVWITSLAEAAVGGLREKARQIYREEQAVDQREKEREKRDARRILDDPESDDESKEWARKVLKE